MDISCLSNEGSQFPIVFFKEFGLCRSSLIVQCRPWLVAGTLLRRPSFKVGNKVKLDLYPMASGLLNSSVGADRSNFHDRPSVTTCCLGAVGSIVVS